MRFSGQRFRLQLTKQVSPSHPCHTRRLTVPSIRKRGSRWQVQVRRTGYPALSRSFDAKADAVAWAREKESAIDRAEFPHLPRTLSRLTVGDLLRRYEREITVRKRGADREGFKIRVLLAHPLTTAPLSKVSGVMVAQYRDDRLKQVSSGTVRRELALLQHCFELARKEWGFASLTNPVRQIVLPEPSKGRNRRLGDEELDRLWNAAKRARAWYVGPIVELALETGMRRGELLSLKWSEIALFARLVRVATSKNGHPRIMPLSPRAVEVLRAIQRKGELVFPISAFAFRQAWDRLTKRAGVVNLRFHDLRHEAISRFFEAGLNVPEVALISGHRTPAMLFRYTHPKPELIAAKLAKGAGASHTANQLETVADNGGPRRPFLPCPS